MTLLLALGMAGMKWGNDIRKWKPGRMLAQWRYGLFLFYLSFLLISAVLSRSQVDPLRNVMSHFWFRKGNVMWNNEIIENILFFIPYTVLFLAAFRPARPWAAALAVSAATTCALEVSQLVLRLGEFQLSDMLYNTLGGMIGCLLWMAAVLVRKKIYGCAARW
ncbi:MAG: VanZ family protein [Clostridia bacterium]|nr:VanZ family protein [Clostridia bacterium]